MLINYYHKAAQQYNRMHSLDQNLTANLASKLNIHRRLAESCMIILFAAVGLIMGPGDSLAVPIWPHLGILVGLLFLRGVRVLPWILIGQMVGYYHCGFTMVTCGLLSAYHTLSIWFIYRLSLSLIGPIAPLSRLSSYLKWIGLNSAFMPLIGLGFAQVWVHLALPGYKDISIMEMVIGHLISTVMFATFCLVWDTCMPSLNTNKQKLRIITLALSGVIFHLLFTLTTNLWLFWIGFGATIPFMTLATYGYHRLGCCWAGMITSLFLIAFIELPGATLLLKYPHLIVGMQLVTLINFVTHLGIAIRREENQFKLFVATHPIFLNKAST